MSSEINHTVKQIIHKIKLNVGEIESDDDEVCDVDIPKVLSRLNALEEMMVNEVKKNYQQKEVKVDKENKPNDVISDVIIDNSINISPIILDPNKCKNDEESASILNTIIEEDIIQEIKKTEVVNEVILLESKDEVIIMDDESIVNDDKYNEENEDEEEEVEDDLSNEEIKDEYINITFSSKINPDLRQYNDGEEIIVNIKSDVTVDDLIFEIRSTVADKAILPLSQVKLSYYGQIVTSGIDVDDDNLTPLSASILAKSGQLLVKIININSSKDNTDFLSEYQLDILVKQFEGNFNANHRYANKSNYNNNEAGRQFYDNNNCNSIGDFKEDCQINKVSHFDLTILNDEANVIDQKDTVAFKNTLQEVYMYIIRTILILSIFIF
jgi:hypothetical protein